MMKHADLTSQKLFRLIKNKEVQWAGNARLRIYGKLNCWSGKRMKKENRVFFKTKGEAINDGFRPCGHCLK
jgi:methylphosphotriester-DNA--protein-cysteine methyltransferase